MVERKHGLSAEETKTNLDKLVEEGTVIKVVYKGNTSYRNADKYRMNKLRDIQSTSDLPNANNVNDILCRAVSSLTEPGEDGRREKRLGASVKDVQKWILLEDATTKIARNRFRLQLALHRAVDSNMLVRLDSGKYVLADVNKGKTVKPDEAETAEQGASEETESPTQTSATEVDTSPTASTSTACAPTGTASDTTTTPVKKSKGRPPTKRKVLCRVYLRYYVRQLPPPHITAINVQATMCPKVALEIIPFHELAKLLTRRYTVTAF